MEAWRKGACVLVALALAGGAGKHVEAAKSDPDKVYGPSEFGEDVGDGIDDIAGGVGDAAGGALGKSDVAKAGALGAGAYGAAKAGKAWRNRAKDPNNVDVRPDEPTLPTLAPLPGVAE
jgi:hypothetical protein